MGFVEISGDLSLHELTVCALTCSVVNVDYE